MITAQVITSALDPVAVVFHSRPGVISASFWDRRSEVWKFSVHLSPTRVLIEWKVTLHIFSLQQGRWFLWGKWEILELHHLQVKYEDTWMWWRRTLNAFCAILADPWPVYRSAFSKRCRYYGKSIKMGQAHRDPSLSVLPVSGNVLFRGFLSQCSLPHTPGDGFFSSINLTPCFYEHINALLPCSNEFHGLIIDWVQRSGHKSCSNQWPWLQQR